MPLTSERCRYLGNSVARSGLLVIGEERFAERMTTLAAAASLRGLSMRQVCACEMGVALVQKRSGEAGCAWPPLNSAFMRIPGTCMAAMHALHASRRPGPYAEAYGLRSKREYRTVLVSGVAIPVPWPFQLTSSGVF